MTIFLDIAKKIIEEEVDTLNNNSQAANTYFGMFRNTKLSEKKISSVSNAVEKIKEIKCTGDDLTNLKTINQIILSCKETFKWKL